MAYTPTWSYGKSVMQLSAATVAPEWSYGQSLLLYVYAAAVATGSTKWLPAFIARRRR